MRLQLHFTFILECHLEITCSAVDSSFHLACAMLYSLLIRIVFNKEFGFCVVLWNIIAHKEKPFSALVD